MFYNKQHGFLKAPLPKEWIGAFSSRNRAQKYIDHHVPLRLRLFCQIINKKSIGKNGFMPLEKFLASEVYQELVLKNQVNDWLKVKTKKVKSQKKEFKTKESYPLNVVLPYIGDYERDYDGDLIWMGDERYQNFHLHGTRCVICGLEGEYFLKQRTLGPKANVYCQYHFNLYGYNSSGQAIMLTKDHIIPRSKGGADALYNYQTMCKTCNSQKSNHLPAREILATMPKTEEEKQLLLNAFDELQLLGRVDYLLCPPLLKGEGIN